MRYTADFRVVITVEFDDDGQHDLRDQAFDALWNYEVDRFQHDAELIARPTPTEGPHHN